MANKEVNIIIKANDNATKGIKATASSIKKLWDESGSTANKVANASNNITGAFNKVAIAATAAFAVKEAVNFGKQMLKTATELELLEKKSSIVFGDFKQGVIDVAKQTANSMWLTTNEFVWAAAGIADILVPLWFAREEAANMSTELVTLSWALAEWSNGQYNAQQAAEILQKAMVGEVEQLKQMGIVIDQSSKAYNDRIKNIMATTGATQEQARALDIQRQIMEKSIDAQTAFKEWGDSMARTQGEAAAKIREVKDTLATALWPQLRDITAKIADVITKFVANEKAMDATIGILWYLGDVIVTTIDFLALMWEWLSNIIERTKQLVSWVSVNFGTIQQIVWEVVSTINSWFTSLWQDIMTAMWWAVDWILWVFDGLKSWVWAVIDWLSGKVTSVINSVNKIKNAISGIGGFGMGGVDWARALWWPVKAGNSYLVGENWPEIFTPGSSGIIHNNATSNNATNNNTFNITVNNAQDESRIVKLIQDTLYKWQRNLSLWIA